MTNSLVVAALLGFEELFSSMSHLLAAALIIVTGSCRVAEIHGAWRRTSWLLFFCSAAILFSVSGTYHMLEFESTERQILRRLDHAAIWILIAGTFTAVHFVSFSGASRWITPVVVWTMSTIGIVFGTIYFSTFPEWLELMLYLAVGWLGIITAILLFRHRGRAVLGHLLFGGLLYSLGALIDFFSNMLPTILERSSHELFHVLVVFAVFVHYRMMIWLSTSSIPHSHKSS